MRKNVEELIRRLLGSGRTTLNTSGTESQGSVSTQASRFQLSGKWVLGSIVLMMFLGWSMVRDSKTSEARPMKPAEQQHHTSEPASPRSLLAKINKLQTLLGDKPVSDAEVDAARRSMQDGADQSSGYGASKGQGQSQGSTTSSTATKNPIAEESSRQMLEQKKREYSSLFASPVGKVGQESVTPQVTAPPTEKQEQGDPPEEDAPTRLSYSSRSKEGLKDCTPVAGEDNETRFCLPEGTIIPARLQTRAISEAAGPVNAMVARDVFPPHDREHVVIPAGTVLLGDAKGSGGTWQERMLITFHRVLLPDGRSVDLEKGLGLDMSGAMGVKGGVNRHILSKAFAVVGYGSLAALTSAGTGSVYNNGYGDSARQAISQEAAMQGQRELTKQLDRPNTLSVDEGQVLDLRLSQDIYLREWGTK